jgi:hypothetical protein
MEIKEIVSYYLNSDVHLLEVTFRTIDDNEDVIRTDNIDYNLVEEYGYELEYEEFDIFGFNEEEDEVVDKNKIELDEDELLSFLNEYYMVNSDKLPNPEIY